jgi:DNA-binding transcriptional LysR family regulator
LTSIEQRRVSHSIPPACRRPCSPPRNVVAKEPATLSPRWGAHRTALWYGEPQNLLGGKPSIADLATHSLIGFDETTEFIRDAGKSLPGWRREAFALRTDSDLAQLALIRSGAGIGICQAAIARRDQAILHVLPKQVSLSLDTWITMHEDLRNSFRVSFEALVKGLQRHVG